MGACGYVTPVMRIKQEIISLTLELESMGEEKDYCHKVLEEDLLNYYISDAMNQTKEDNAR